MKEITKDNYKEFLSDFFGIIVAIPKKDLVYNADFYIYGSRVNDKIIFHDIAYNMEDGAINGFSVLNVNLKEEDMFKNFDTMNYYQFDNMTEFCFWYLKQQSLLPEDIYTEINEIGFMPMSDTQIKGLDDFIKQNSTFAELPEELIEKLHSREKRIQSLCEKVRAGYINATQNYTHSPLNTSSRQKDFSEYFSIPKLSKEAFDKIEEINNTPLTKEKEEVIKKFVEETDKFYGTMKDKEWIQEKCGTNTPPISTPNTPPILSNGVLGDSNFASKTENAYDTWKPFDGGKIRIQTENGVKWMSKEEVDEMMFPGHKKRRNKYKDIIELVEHIVEYGLQRDTLEKRKKEVGWASFQEPIQKMIDDLDKKYDDWLDEEC